MSGIGSSGTKFYVNGPHAVTGQGGHRALAYITIGAALLLSIVALVRLGSAASAAVAAVSSALPAASLSARHAHNLSGLDTGT